MGFITPNDYGDLRSLYTGQLQYLLSTETQIVKGLETMIEELVSDYDDKKYPITTALISSGANIVRETSEGPVRDAGLLATAQKIEHYEIASYGAARSWAALLGLAQQAELLQKSLEEEKHADHLLSTISDRVNAVAAQA